VVVTNTAVDVRSMHRIRGFIVTLCPCIRPRICPSICGNKFM
jgi:hypothetical protein